MYRSFLVSLSDMMAAKTDTRWDGIADGRLLLFGSLCALPPWNVSYGEGENNAVYSSTVVVASTAAFHRP